MTNHLPEGVSMTNAAQTDEAKSREELSFSELRGLMERASPVEHWSQNRDAVTISRAASGLGGYFDCWMGTAANARLVLAAVRALGPLLDERDRLIGENERLRLEMMGGEDAPGYVASMSLDNIILSFREHQSFMRSVTEARALSAEGEVEKLRSALETLTNQCEAEFTTDGRWVNDGQLVTQKAFKAARQALSQEIG